jgi:hypothetical protein
MVRGSRLATFQHAQCRLDAGIVHAYESPSGKKLRVERLGSLDGLDARIDHLRKTEPANMRAWLPLMYYRSVLNGVNTVAGNEALVLDAAKRYPHATVFGLNPGLHRTEIRGNLLGQGTLKARFVEWMIGLWSTSAETYAERLTPLFVSPDLETHSGAMFGQKGNAILPSAQLKDESYVRAFMTASEALVSRAHIRLRA